MSYGGDLTNKALTGTLHEKNISAFYIEPKKEWEFEKEVADFSNMSVNEILEQIPKNWKDNSDRSYWKTREKIFFSAKDGQTNAYVKRGVDEILDEYMDRQETQRNTWQIATDDPIDFRPGGKVIVLGKEYFILKVIIMQTIGTYQNKFMAMDTHPENSRGRLIGVKTLILA